MWRNQRREDWKDTAPGRPRSARRPPDVSTAGSPIPTAAKTAPGVVLRAPGRISTTNAGRFYSYFPGRTRARPPCSAGRLLGPVKMNVHAGSWLIASVFTRPHDGDVVHDCCDVRQQLADPGTDLPVLIEIEDRRSDRKALLPRRHRRDPLAHPHRIGQILVEQLVQLRLVVKSSSCDGPPFIER